MSKSLEEIAQMLKDNDKKVQLIYAFNGTGKTRLSKAFANLIAPKSEDQEEPTRKKILYYNAFTEDLFHWDNDLEEDKAPKLNIKPNRFTNWILKDQGQDQNVISKFQHYTNEKLNPRFNEERKEKDNNEKEITIPALFSFY